MIKIMDGEQLHRRLEQLRIHLATMIEELGNLRDDRVIEASQHLDLLIVHAQKIKRDKPSKDVSYIKTTA